MADDEKLQELEEALCTRVRDWLRRVAPLLNRTIEVPIDYAEITIRVDDPGWDDDNVLILRAKIEENSHTAELEGRVPEAKDPRT